MKKEGESQMRKINEFSKIGIALMWISFMFVTGCTFSKEKETDIFQGSLAKGILYNEKIYWQTSTSENPKDGQEIGKVKKIEKRGVFPTKEFSVTQSAEEIENKKVYSDEELLYIENKNEVQIFEYRTEMELGEEVPLNLEAESEGMALPHFVYENMRYLLNTELSVEKLPKSFVKVGKIEKTCMVAAKNNTGNLDMGTEFYASEFQNRYMIVKNPDRTYSVYENEGY